MNIYKRALELFEETVTHRRWFHTHAEVGLDMPQAKIYVINTLRSYGITATECGHGIMATIGKGDKTILLRADMDALPMKEESGLDFACPTGTEAHTCGHDFHAAMLLTAAKILKENESELRGVVKLMFQPAEEILKGAKDMITHGILEHPKPDSALAFHVTSGNTPIGMFYYNNVNPMMHSVDNFKITIHGKGTHGAYPHKGVDPINIGVHIHLALQELIARETDSEHASILTVGHFEGGTTGNVIPDTAVLEGALRTNHKETRIYLLKRLQEITITTAEAFQGTANIEFLSEIPPLECNPKLTTEFVSYLHELPIPHLQEVRNMTASASEDFALITEQIPSTMIYLSAGFPDKRGSYLAHNPKVQFNEDVCPIGVAAYAYCAIEWLRRHN